LARSHVEDYFATLASLCADAEVTDGAGRAMTLEEAVAAAIAAMRAAGERRNKLMLVGNGGSAGIASHLAIDYSKNGGIPAMAFNDGAALTCLGNDLGYENVFSRQIAMFGHEGDVLVAISSSGRSPNILEAVKAARALGCGVLTLSGFDTDNPLRRMGDLNFHVASHVYGFVEVSHLAICHAILDIAMGWSSARAETGQA